jgi:hypothetical protein
MKKPKYLTKSRFKIARDCVTKLHYSVDKSYASLNDDNDFLKALAEGGYQVGELAKFYYPGGHDIDVLDKDEALERTNELLKQDNVIIYEAAILYENLFIRADVLVKVGNNVKLIEVKAKSGNSETDKLMVRKKVSRKKDAPEIDMVNKDFEDYIYDIAFQTYVVENAFPQWSVDPYLMLADKSKVASVDGLNQFFLLAEEDGRTIVKIKEGTSKETLGIPVLSLFDARGAIDLIMSGRDQGEKSRSELNMKSFTEEIHYYAEVYEKDGPEYRNVDRTCNGCEFNCSKVELKNGFNECWSKALNVEEHKIDLEPNIFEIWNLHYKTKEKLLEDNVFFLADVQEEDILKGKPTPSKLRQWQQVEETKKDEPRTKINIEELKSSISSFKYPLNFIDFETSMVAIPFFKGQTPYEQVAFQFSHHILHEDGKVEHAGEYINNTPGAFPNFEFVRALKKSLDVNDGTIFRFAPHENTVLCQIFMQLLESDEKDKEELMDWIQTITKYNKNGYDWEGARNMIDMCEMVKAYYWHPIMKGSNSIKVVLPAILNSSKFIQEKYQFPIYGNEIKSLNFEDHQWIPFEGKDVVNPYLTLPKVFEGLDKDDCDLITTAEALKDGGAAMTAYARMQFSEMSDSERNALTNALLRYCELDTMAMVMIMEAWIDWCGMEEKLKKVG